MLGHGGSSAGSYLADPTSPIPSHCAVIILFQKPLLLCTIAVTGTVRVKVHCYNTISGIWTDISACFSISATTFGRGSSSMMFGNKIYSSVWRQKGLTGYCLKYVDRPFCLQADVLYR